MSAKRGRFQVTEYVKQWLDQISNDPDREVKARLARLRRGVGKKPGELPELWCEFLQSRDCQDMPKTWYSWHSSGIPTYEEWAVYTTLTLFALHQQGRDIQKEYVHQEGKSLGAAAAELVKEKDDQERIWRRFCKVSTADDMEELNYYLRGMVQLFKANEIGLDYVKLAGDLYDFQYREIVDRVRLRWGEDFYRIRMTDDEGGTKNE